jgi:hypothetical protein
LFGVTFKVFISNAPSRDLRCGYYSIGRPVPVAARCSAQVYGRSPAAIVGSIPTRGMDVCFVYCVSSSRGLCDELITRPEGSTDCDASLFVIN